MQSADKDNRERPNVVVIMTDQLRHDHLGYAGNETVETPHIDALAAGGVVCERAYVANPLCMPARATVFTGRRPRDHGVRTNGITLDKDIPTLPETFHKAGYRTHGAGKFHHQNYALQMEDIVRLINAGEVEISDFPPSFEPRLKRAIEELNVGSEPLPSASNYPEGEALWKAGIAKSLPEPYYGFETTDFVAAHGDIVYGEYRNWLESTHPSSFEKLFREHPANEPGEAPESWRWALPAEHHYNHWITKRAREFLDDAVSPDMTSDDQPFFVFCSFPDPHHPYAAPEPYASMYDPASVLLPTRREDELTDLSPVYQMAYEAEEPELSGMMSTPDLSDSALREMIAITYGMVSFVDDEVGRLLTKLEDLGIRDNTIVLFCSDHGDMMGDHWMIQKGPFQFDGLIRIPCIWNWPGGLPEGERTDGLISAVDVFPTLLELCDVPSPYRDVTLPENLSSPPELAGQSLVDQLRGDREAVNESVIIENDEDYLGLRIRTYITDQYKLTVYPGKPYGELFDLEADPDELHNRWDDPEYEGTKQRLYREFLEAYILGDSGLPERTSHAG